MLAATLPRTKCLAPTTHGTVARSALVAHLAAQVEAHRVTLLSAPAGAGKTSLLAALLPALRPRLVAWLALDDEDTEPKRFVLGVTAALQSVAPGFGQRSLAALAERPGDLPPRQLVGALVNDLLDGIAEPFALILDDLHQVQDPLSQVNRVEARRHRLRRDRAESLCVFRVRSGTECHGCGVGSSRQSATQAWHLTAPTY